MGKNYIRKTDRGLRYSKQQLLEAVRKVRSGELNGNQAARRYNIPRTTISDWITGAVKTNRIGKPPVFPHSFEKTVADNLKTLQNHGFALTKKKIGELVGYYAKSNNIKVASKSGNPGGYWLSAFEKRHNFSAKPLYVEFGSKDREVILVKEFYDLIESKTNELELAEKPGNIWHIEEHSFNEGKRVVNTDREKDFTVLTACSAKGEKVPLLIVFQGEETREWILGKHIHVSHNEGMCREVFKKYFTTVFMNHIDDSHPNLIIYDGQCSHMDIGLVEHARKARITLINSPNLDELDISITKTLQHKWGKEAETFAGSSKEFANVVANVYENTESFEIEEGFRNAGVYPFSAVCDSKFDSTRLKEYEDYKIFKTDHLSSKADVKENELNDQAILMLELDSSTYATEVEAVFLPGNELLKTHGRQNTRHTRLAVRKGLTINEDHGLEAVLTDTEENQLLAWIMHLAEAGFSITDEKVSDAVYDLVNNSKRAFNSKMPNRDWYNGFLKRHPEIAGMISIDLKSDTESVEDWFESLQSYLKAGDLSDILNYPERVFNCKAATYLIPKHNETNNETATNVENLTVYVTASGLGELQPPSVISHLGTEFTTDSIGRSMSSWSHAEFFHDYITDVFYPCLTENDINFPVVLLMDDTAPINFTLLEFCNNKQIIIMALPNHIQPLQTVFNQFKLYLEAKVTEQILGKEDIAKDLEDYLKKDFAMEIRRGFTKCGFHHIRTGEDEDTRDCV